MGLIDLLEKKMNVCQRCIMPDSYPDVTLDGEGTCSLCKAHDASPRLDRPARGRDTLLQVLTSRSPGHYDCVVPVSGGKDSSYALFYIVRELSLKPLAVFSDSGFVADAAKRNIQILCDQLSVDLVVHRARFRRRLTREALYIWKYRGAFSVCPPCETNNRSVAIREATRRGIPFIIWGATDFEDDATTFLDPNAPTWRQRFARSRQAAGKTPRLIARHILEVTGLNLVYQALKIPLPANRRQRLVYHTFKYLYYRIRNNLDVDVPEGWRKFLPTVETSFDGKPVETVYIFDYVPYDPRRFVATLKRELGWQAPKDRESRMDCKLHALVAYQHLKETGITKDGFTLSVLVRYGLLTREEAKRKEEATKRDLLKNCERVLRELGVHKEGILP